MSAFRLESNGRYDELCESDSLNKYYSSLKISKSDMLKRDVIKR